VEPERCHRGLPFRQYPALGRQPGQLDPRSEAQLDEYMAQVRVHRVGGQVEAAGHLAVGGPRATRLTTANSDSVSSGHAGGVQPALLGTVKDASGKLEVTYNHWPLYTFSGDPGPGVAHGQGLVSFGGTWYVLNAAGNPVTSGQPSAGGPSSSGGGNGY
jgi:hypothetical protein